MSIKDMIISLKIKDLPDMMSISNNILIYCCIRIKIIEENIVIQYYFFLLYYKYI